ncbi:MAG: hypothetical protein R8G66_29010 [Cytophagales bacterium]|nr:hypothetical protein [Cytophagales bacterium]
MKEIRTIQNLQFAMFDWMNGFFDLLVKIIDHNTDLKAIEDDIKNLQSDLAQIRSDLNKEVEILELGELDKAFFIKSVTKLLSVNLLTLRMSKIQMKPTDFLDWDDLIKIEKNTRSHLSQFGQQDLQNAWVAFNQCSANLIFKIKKRSSENNGKRAIKENL